MPFTDAVSIMSGRNSRASNVSGMTGASHSIRSVPPPNDTLNSAGVLSMLKTSTDTGDIGALSFNTSRLPSMPRAAHPRRAHGSKLSGSSHGYQSVHSQHNYAPSQVSKFGDGTSLHRRGSFTSMQNVPFQLPPGHASRMPQAPALTYDKSRDSRSYSLTSAPTSQQIPRLHSATSLKSAGHEPRHHPRMYPGQPPPMPENKPPYIYPTRLKRPGYRSPSPALSDLSAHGHPSGPMPGSRRPPTSVSRPQPQTHNSDYAADYRQDTRYVGQRSNRKNTHHMPYDTHGSHHGYRQGPGRPENSMLPVPSMQQQQQSMYYGPPRSGHPGTTYNQRPNHSMHPAMHHGHPQLPQRGPPAPTMAPAAHSMFHNAARMTRSVPRRSDTPVMDLSPPSSDPPSSGTMASSSNPPTPKDSTAGQAAVDPIFIDPTLADLPDSSSEPVLPHRYFEFADGLHKPVDSPEVNVYHPSVPATGFVQRVRAMLESKAATEPEVSVDAMSAEQQSKRTSTINNVSERHFDIHELPANEAPRFTIIEEFDAPVELPASPVRLPELASANSPSSLNQRITREMVRAELGPWSIDSSTQNETADDLVPVEDAQVSIEQRPRTQHHRSASHQPTTTGEQHPVQDDSTPDAEQPCQQPVAESTTTLSTVSVERTAISGIDYALRFSVPMDTTTEPENETQSKNPFVLDADTITLKHHQSRERVAAPHHTIDVGERSITIERPGAETPVSSMKFEEGVSRTSAISPLDEGTAAADLKSHNEHQDFSDLESSLLASSPPPVAPSTPRTPRQYSKSVEIPYTRTVPDDTPTSNRFSLPPDFSNVGDTTVDSTTEMVTDVAVRFSLPNTTITVDKPHIVTIAPSSSPEALSSQPMTQASRLNPRTARRSSVTFADQIVAPLNIKKVDPRDEFKTDPEPLVIRTKSIMRRPSPLEVISGIKSVPSNRDSDPRFAASNAIIPGRFGSTHLPGLKEESTDDVSISDQKRGHKRDENFQFPLPARIAAVKAMQERRLQESAEKAKARRAARQHNRPIAEIRDLPSLNFSTMDLVDKLNFALGNEMRPSKSMEVTRVREISEIFCPSPQRPQSTEPLRERYTSFFTKPEELADFSDSSDEDQNESDEVEVGIPALQVQESTEVGEPEQHHHLSLDRPLSPEEFLSVATQVNRLSIPSVSGLSERLSELLPCLKNLHLGDLLSSDDDVAHTIDDIHQLGRGPRPGTTLSCRTSAGFRTLAERAEEIVLNGTHDSAFATSQSLSINKELPPLPESASADQVSNVTPTDGKQCYLSGSVSAPSVFANHLTRPESALIRQKSPMTEEEVLQMLPPETNPIARGGKRSLMLSGISTRPWNQDENYPWAGSNITIDLNIPSAAHTRNSITGEVVRAGRRSKSLDFSSLHDVSEGVMGIDIGSITTLNRSASCTTEQATGVPVHARKQSMRSIIGSLSKKMGLGHRHTTANGDNTTRNIASPVKPSCDRESMIISHRAGDRYPTSSLTPPSNLNLDEVRSFFSDDSSERLRNISLKKRLTNFKQKGKSVRLDAHTSSRSVEAGETTYDAGLVAAERLGATSSAHNYDAGMGKAEFHIKRFGERIRLLVAKGGELFRTFSRRRSRAPKAGRVREDWLSDSLYSGV